MRALLIILGLSAAQLQDQTAENLNVGGLYDIDSRHIQGPISVRYQIKGISIELPEAELVSLSFRMGILTSATVNPHRRPLKGAETAELCQELQKTFLEAGFVFPHANAGQFRKLIEQLKRGEQPTEPLPPWRFGWRLGNEKVNLVIRPFESSSPRAVEADVKKYVIALEFGNMELDDAVYRQMRAIRARHFSDRRGRIPLSQYPK